MTSTEDQVPKVGGEEGRETFMLLVETGSGCELSCFGIVITQIGREEDNLGMPQWQGRAEGRKDPGLW